MPLARYSINASNAILVGSYGAAVALVLYSILLDVLALLEFHADLPAWRGSHWGKQCSYMAELAIAADSGCAARSHAARAAVTADLFKLFPACAE
jgi:hypothetical protein